MILYELAYLVFVIWLAINNADRIELGKRIYHGLNGALHLAAAAGAWFVFGWEVAVALLLLVRATFDTALNLARGKAVDYVSQKPKSIVDKIERAVFGNNGILPKLIYVAAAITLDLINYL